MMCNDSALSNRKSIARFSRITVANVLRTLIALCKDRGSMPLHRARERLVPRAETFGPICRHAAKGLPVLVHLNGFAMVRLK